MDIRHLVVELNKDIVGKYSHDTFLNIIWLTDLDFHGLAQGPF